MEGGREGGGNYGTRGWWGDIEQGEGVRKGEWEGGRERARGREKAMMLGRQRASLEEGRVERGRVDEGNKRGRGEAWTSGGRKLGKWIERGREGARVQGRDTSRELS